MLLRWLCEKTTKSVHKKPVITITMDLIPEIFPAKYIPLTKKFTITYTGRIYNGKQDPTKILSAVSDLIKDNLIDSQKIEIRFYGEKLTWLDVEIEKYGLKNIAIQYGRISKEESLIRQRDSQLLLLLCWEDKE